MLREARRRQSRRPTRHIIDIPRTSARPTTASLYTWSWSTWSARPLFDRSCWRAGTLLPLKFAASTILEQMGAPPLSRAHDPGSLGVVHRELEGATNILLNGAPGGRKRLRQDSRLSVLAAPGRTIRGWRPKGAVLRYGPSTCRRSRAPRRAGRSAIGLVTRSACLFFEMLTGQLHVPSRVIRENLARKCSAPRRPRAPTSVKKDCPSGWAERIVLRLLEKRSAQSATQQSTGPSFARRAEGPASVRCPALSVGTKKAEPNRYPRAKAPPVAQPPPPPTAQDAPPVGRGCGQHARGLFARHGCRAAYPSAKRAPQRVRGKGRDRSPGGRRRQSPNGLRKAEVASPQAAKLEAPRTERGRALRAEIGRKVEEAGTRRVALAA